MGNRAIITNSKSRTTGVGIYVHWNGGPESVLAFLRVCQLRGYRAPGADGAYAMARLCGLICEFFPGNSSVGIGQLCDLDCDNYDNGVYVIDDNWRVVDTWGEGSRPLKETLAFDDIQREQYDAIVEKLSQAETTH